MKKIVLVLVLFSWVAFYASAERAFGELILDRFQLDQGWKNHKFFVGDDNRGRQNVGKLEFFAESHHRRFLALSVTNMDQSNLAMDDLQKDHLKMALGLKIPLSIFSLKFVYNHGAEQGTDESIDLFGLFPEFKLSEINTMTLGYEHNAVKTSELKYAFVRSDWRKYLTSFFGLSVADRPDESEKSDLIITTGAILKRYGFWTLTGMSISSAGGSWPYTFGLAYPATGEGQELNPSGLLVFRHREQSDYLLGIVTLGGRGVKHYIVSGVFEAMNRGLNSPARVLKNRNFDIGIGSGYKDYEFGTINLIISHVRTEIMDDLYIHGFEAALYQVFYRSRSVFHRQYAGMIVESGSEVPYDFASHSLLSKSHQTAKIKLGAYCALNDDIVLDLSGTVFFWNQVEGGGIQLSLVW